MRVIINESRFDSIFSNWLKEEGITLSYRIYPSRRSGYDEIRSGGIYLIQDNKEINFSPYIFSYKVDEDKRLIFQEDYNPYQQFNLFKIFPSEYVKYFFVDKVKNYLQKKFEGY
jgi:hypothetical protein